MSQKPLILSLFHLPESIECPVDVLTAVSTWASVAAHSQTMATKPTVSARATATHSEAAQTESMSHVSRMTTGATGTSTS